MADDNIDFRFLGQQVKNLQAEVRDLRSASLRLDSDIVGIRADLSRLEQQVSELACSLTESLADKPSRAEMHQALEQLRIEVTGLFRHLDQKIDSGLSALDARIDRSFTALNRKIDSGLSALDAKIDSGLSALDAKIDNHHRAHQAQMDQMVQTNSTLLQIVITKLNDLESRLPPRH